MRRCLNVSKLSRIKTASSMVMGSGPQWSIEHERGIEPWMSEMPVMPRSSSSTPMHRHGW